MDDDAVRSAVVGGDGRLIPARTTERYLRAHGMYDYVMGRYQDSTTGTLAEAVYRIANGLNEIPRCKVCGKPVTFNHGYASHCSQACTAKDPEVLASNAAHVSESLKAAYAERGDEIRGRRAATLERRYGCRNLTGSAFEIPSVGAKARETVRERYGVDCVLSLPENRPGRDDVRRMVSERWKARGYDVEVLDDGRYLIKGGCPVHGDITMGMREFEVRARPERASVSPICPICNPYMSYSGEEETMAAFLKGRGVDFTRNDRSLIPPYELDFVIRDRKVAIELNGVYFHSDALKPRDYHLMKTELCERIGYRLIHVWEDDLADRTDVVLSMIADRLGLIGDRIPARKCEVRMLGTAECREFMECNHLQGSVNASRRFGLTYGGEIVAAMTFGKARISLGSNPDGRTCEMYRFCTRKWLVVPGGASRLFSHARRALADAGFERIVTYAKRDWSAGGVYGALGFTPEGVTAPGYSWVVGRRRMGRFGFRKSLIADPGDPRTEVEIMHSRGVRRCFDSGNLKYAYDLKK